MQKQECVMCKKAHHLSNCLKYLRFFPEKRVEVLEKVQLCLNYIKPGHFIKNCKSSTCKKCADKHNILIHFEGLPSKKATVPEKNNNSPSVLCSHNHRTTDRVPVLLSNNIYL